MDEFYIFSRALSEAEIGTLALLVPAAPADFDEDGDVDSGDLAQWQGDFGVNGLSDADNDGDSDGADFLAWQQQLGSGSPGVAAVQSVPELGASVLAALAGSGLALMRRRQLEDDRKTLVC